MNKIEDLAKKGKIYLLNIAKDNDKSTYKISEDLLVEFNLYKNKELDENSYKKLILAINKDAYYQKVLHYALFKPRTKKEIITYLKKFNIEDFDYYLNKLFNLKLLDDKAYAENYVSEAINYKHYGPAKIKEDLFTKGINSKLQEEFLSYYDSTQIRDNLDYWFDKKIKNLKNNPYQKNLKSLTVFLINKGFSYEDVSNYLKHNQQEIIDKSDESKAIIKDIEHLKVKYQKKEYNLSLQQFLINKLLAKGYQYSTIKKYL
jgi:regulatory protein